MCEKMTKRVVDSFFEADIGSLTVIFYDLSFLKFGVGCRRAPLRATTRKFQSCALFSRSPQPPFLVFNNVERFLFPESDYADWKVRDFAVSPSRDERRNERLREAKLRLCALFVQEINYQHIHTEFFIGFVYNPGYKM